MILAGIAGVLSLHVAWNFYNYNDVIGKRIAAVFFTSALILFVTLLFGLATAVGIDADYILYPLRAVLIFLNIFADIRLMMPVPYNK